MTYDCQLCLKHYPNLKAATAHAVRVHGYGARERVEVCPNEPNTPAPVARQTCKWTDPFNRACVLLNGHRSSHHVDAATIEPWMNEARQTIAECGPECGKWLDTEKWFHVASCPVPR